MDSVAPGRRRYPLALKTLEEVVETFNIPLPFVNILAAHTTIALDFDTDQDCGQPSVKPTGVICVLGPISLAVSYNTATKITTGIVLGLCGHQAISLITSIRKISQAAHVPMLLPTLLLNVLGETRAHRVLGRKRAINGIEVALGIHWGVETGLGPRNIGLENATQQLTMYGSELAWDIHAIDAQMDMVTLIEEVQESINGQNNALHAQSRDLVAFRARTRRIRQVLSGLMHWTRYNQQRVQVQLQIVIVFMFKCSCSKADQR